MTILTVRPYYDKATHYLFHWCQKFIDEFIISDKIVDLKEKRANVKEFTSVVKKIKPSIIFLNGHGNESIVSGQDGNIVLEINKNEEITKGVIVYAIACRSAAKLGFSCVKKGAIAYIGYVNDFIFINDLNSVHRPLNDKRAAYFLEPSNKVMVSLAKGLSPKEAHKNSKKMFIENIQHILTKEPSETYLVAYLFWDYKYQVCIE